mmetsp:Transcript_28531/g.32640  ORF Transcript_28531/g.32640 Transcript_28531/m.32640 type:complete len:202 (-) Transcript_28531:132-737(-)
MYSQRHGIFPGTVKIKPYSLKRQSNISRDLEGCHSSSQRFLPATAFEHLQKLFKEDKYTKVVAYCKEVIEFHLREKCRYASLDQYSTMDFVLLAEFSCLNGLIDNSDMYEVLQINTMLDNDLTPVIPRAKSFNLNHYWEKPGVRYDYESLPYNTKKSERTQEEAITSIKILYNFTKKEQERHQKFNLYEPFIAQVEQWLFV